MTVYDIGDKATLRASFTDDSSPAQPADPSALTFYLKLPDGTVTEYVYGTDAELVRDAVGEYHVDWTITVHGVYWYLFAGSGDVVAVEEETFTVRTRKTQ